MALLIGMSLALAFSWIIVLAGLFFLCLCCSVPLSSRKIVFLIILMCSGFFYVNALYTIPSLPPEGIKGTAYLHVDALSKRRSHFGTHWVYRATMEWFQDENGRTLAQRVPVVVSILDQPDLFRPEANSDYQVTGTLKTTKKGGYLLAPSKEAPWLQVHGTWSPAEWRYLSKSYVSSWIADHIASARAGSFLSGIATGDFDDRLLSFELARFGVQHIMAISGFHFGILAAILGLVLRALFGVRLATISLLGLMTAYFCFIGPSPSVARAWITIAIALLAQLWQSKGHALNSLGVALLIVLIANPLSINNLGFQFSFLATAAILLGYPAFNEGLHALWRKRPLANALQLSKRGQHGYYLLSLTRQSLALTLAVHLVAIPLTLYHFHKFPIMSLLYNLFFPFLVSISMLLLILAALLAIIPPAASLLNGLNTYFTDMTLNLTFHMPPSVDYAVRIFSCSHEWVILYTTLVCSLLIALHMRDRDEFVSP